MSKACAQVQGFEEMYRRLERRMKTQRRSESTKKNYARHADLPNKENGNTVKPMVIVFFL
ncbi:MAG: hypothetical protein ACK504_03075 [Bacteroidota bacterium]